MEKKVLDVEAKTFIENLAKKIKEMKEFSMPEWAKYVKTSRGNERPPDNPDWWYYRAASILRKLYIKGVIGVERLRKEYKRRKRNKAYPASVYKAGGKIIRTILQQAEKAGFVEKVKEKKGRQLTKKGKEFLEKLAKEI
jgi:small subunit ribosomal protein S19e